MLTRRCEYREVQICLPVVRCQSRKSFIRENSAVGSGMILEGPIHPAASDIHKRIILRESTEDCKCFETCKS